MFFAGRGPKRHVTYLVALLAVMATQVRFQALSKELELDCDSFVDNETAHCDCSIDKTAADSKCGGLSVGQLTKVLISLRPRQDKANADQDVTLCNFTNFTLGQLSPANASAEMMANCSTRQPDEGSVYVMKTSFVVSRERHEGLYVTCWPGCENGVIDASLMPSNDSAVQIKFASQDSTDKTDNPLKTAKSKPLSIIFISTVAGVAAGAAMIIGGICTFYLIKRHNRNAWTPMPPTKRICYDGPLPVQLPRTPSPKGSKSGSVSNRAGSQGPTTPPEEKDRKTSTEEEMASLASSEVDDSEAGGGTDGSAVPDT